MKPWSERKLTSKQIIEELDKKGSEISNVKLEFFEPPAVPGFGAAGGFSTRVLDKTNTMNYQRLGEVTEKFMAALSKRKEVKGLFTFFASNYPQYELVINNDIAMQKGVSIGTAMDNLSIVVGSTWEQGFILFGQFFKVYVQASPEFRRFPEDFANLFVKNERGGMVPYSSFMQIKKKQGMNEINRYNLYPSAAIQGAPAAGYSSGQAIQAIQEVAAETLPRGYGLGWEGLSYDEAGKGNLAVYIFLIVVAFVYLVLVGQYESFILPLAVILSLPVGLYGSFQFLNVMGLSNDVYAQIGLVMLVGLLGKNAILIVEFAVQRRREGLSLVEAAIEGGKLRFRPILMTSFAFIAGLLPLVVATGPGAIGNRTIGTTAVGGMLVGTLLGVLVIPGLYYIFGKISDGRYLLRDEVDKPLTVLVRVDQDLQLVQAGRPGCRHGHLRSRLPAGTRRLPEDRLPPSGDRVHDLRAVLPRAVQHQVDGAAPARAGPDWHPFHDLGLPRPVFPQHRIAEERLGTRPDARGPEHESTTVGDQEQVAEVRFGVRILRDQQLRHRHRLRPSR